MSTVSAATHDFARVLAADHLLAELVGPRTLTASEATDTIGDRRAAGGI